MLAARSYLVAQQHDDHILLGVLVDLCQPGLDTEKEARPVKESSAERMKGGGGGGEKRREGQRRSGDEEAELDVDRARGEDG